MTAQLDEFMASVVRSVLGGLLLVFRFRECRVSGSEKRKQMKGERRGWRQSGGRRELGLPGPDQGTWGHIKLGFGAWQPSHQVKATRGCADGLPYTKERAEEDSGLWARSSEGGGELGQKGVGLRPDLFISQKKTGKGRKEKRVWKR